VTAPVDRNRPVGIMGAFDLEVESILAVTEIVSSETVGGCVFMRGWCADVDVVVCESGIGKVNASAAAATMIGRFDVRALIFAGIAGGVDPNLRVGDVVITEQAVEHDYGDVTDTGYRFEQRGIPVFVDGVRVRRKSFAADRELVDLANRAVHNVKLAVVPTEPARQTGVFSGLVVSGDQFIASAAKAAELHQQHGALCVDMETAAVAHVCEMYGVPWCAIRTISDVADKRAFDDAPRFASHASATSARIVQEMMRLLAN